METLTSIVSVLQHWVDEWVGLLPRLSREIALALLLIPIVLAIASRHGAMAVGCVILILSALIVFISPSSTPVIIGTCLYAGGVTMAVSAIFAQRKARNTRTELALLRLQVNDLLAAEQRRLLRDIRSASKE